MFKMPLKCKETIAFGNSIFTSPDNKAISTNSLFSTKSSPRFMALLHQCLEHVIKAKGTEDKIYASKEKFKYN